MNTRYLLFKFGTSFATRTKAEEIVHEMSKVVSTEWSRELTIDFTGVRVITPSFALVFIEQLFSLLNRPSFNKESINIVGDSPLVQDRLKQVLQHYVSYSKKTPPLDRVLIG